MHGVPHGRNVGSGSHLDLLVNTEGRGDVLGDTSRASMSALFEALGPTPR